MKKFITKIKKLPVALSGLALGISGLANILSNEIAPQLSYIGVLIAIPILLVVFIKKVVYFKGLLDELANPILGGFIPAFDMALMVVSNIIAHKHLLIGQILWYIALAMHIIFASIFIYYQIKNFKFNKINPSWFIPPIGIIVACVTNSTINAPILIVHSVFYFGFASYCVVLPIIMYRLLFGETMNDDQLPSFAILASPASLCLAGYLAVFHHPNKMIMDLLLHLGLIMTILVYISIVRINPLRIKFIPIYASFTFPLTIGATAVIKYAEFIGKHTISGQNWYYIGISQLVIACIVVTWVFICMVMFVYHNILKHNGLSDYPQKSHV